MSNYDTIKSIADNLESVLRGLGIHFDRKTYEDIGNIPASVLPHGEIFYRGEVFEYTHGQRAGYAEGLFRLRVILRERTPADVMREQMRWVHLVRDVLTVNALNIGSLATSKLISLVTTGVVEVDNIRTDSVTADVAAMDYSLSIRYREV